MSSKSNFFKRVLNLTLVAQYDFNNDLVDSIGGNNGTGTDITFNNGAFGNEAVFNGTTSQVLTPNSTVWDISNGTNDIPIKIEVLVKFGIQSNQYVLAKCPTGGSGWEILKFGSQVFVNIYDNLTTGFIQIACDVQTDSNGYSLIEFSYDGSGSEGGLNLNINGISNNLLRNLNSYTRTKLLTNNTTFGRAERRIDRFLNGAISQIKLYK